MRIYVAGPMRGYVRFNKDAFEDAERLLTFNRRRVRVVTPVTMDIEAGFDVEALPDDWDWSTLPDDFDWSATYDRCLQAVSDCQCVYLLDGWRNSTGATAEVAVALWQGKLVIELNSGRTITSLQNPAPATESPKTEEQPVKAARHNSGKPSLSQLHRFRLSALSAHCDAGRSKYPDMATEAGETVPNWTLGGKPDSEYLDAIDRHLGEIVRGETHDRESGTLHAAAIAWNSLALITLNYTGIPDTVGK